jgi:hypothetical protein
MVTDEGPNPHWNKGDFLAFGVKTTGSNGDPKSPLERW